MTTQGTVQLQSHSSILSDADNAIDIGGALESPQDDNTILAPSTVRGDDSVFRGGYNVFRGGYRVFSMM